jgi:hypothetical protein
VAKTLSFHDLKLLFLKWSLLELLHDYVSFQINTSLKSVLKMAIYVFCPKL